MSTPVSVREASEDDLPDVLRLYAQPTVDDGDILDLDEAASLFERFAAYPNYKLYVATMGETVVGSFALLIMDNLGHRGAPSGVMEDVVVDPAQHRQGIGAAMTEAALEICREHKCYKLTLSASLKRDAAHRFYESMGFERHGYSFLIRLDG